ncbi:MAG: DUF6477 family protein [Marinibacterium sp.]|nr:DUF6477 family protein [Marinibacterium sp.]
MQDIMTTLRQLNRPRLLVRAARLGAKDYNRDRHLQRILGYGALPRSGPALMRLLELERDMDDMRRAEDHAYSLSRHLDLLIALVGEARVLNAMQVAQGARV